MRNFLFVILSITFASSAFGLCDNDYSLTDEITTGYSAQGFACTELQPIVPEPGLPILPVEPFVEPKDGELSEIGIQCYNEVTQTSRLVRVERRLTYIPGLLGPCWGDVKVTVEN